MIQETLRSVAFMQKNCCHTCYYFASTKKKLPNLEVQVRVGRQLLKILKPHQVFDEFTFWTFSQIFEAIFYKKKVAHQVFDDGFTFWNLDRIFEVIFSTRKKQHVNFLTDLKKLLSYCVKVLVKYLWKSLGKKRRMPRITEIWRINGGFLEESDKHMVCFVRIDFYIFVIKNILTFTVTT